MKQKAIVGIIEEHFKTINKLSRKILKKFDKHDIHDFRIEVKKLRAFLRLLNKQKKSGDIALPPLLKTFYSYAGNIRDVQLHQRNLKRYVEDYGINKPGNYFKLISREEKHWEEEAAALLKYDSLKHISNDIIKNLPCKLKKSSVKKFAKRKSEKLKKHLQNFNNETAMHKIRKVLKDILYTLRYIKKHFHLKEAISTEEDIKPLVDALGNFIDKCTQLHFLEPAFLNRIKNKEEKATLFKIKNEYGHEKDLITQELHYNLNELNAAL